MKDNLVQLVKDYALKFGEFELSSGQKSNYFIDASRLTLLSGGLRQIASAIVKVLPLQFLEAIGGPSTGADPIIGAVLAHPSVNVNMRGFLVRKEPKKGQLIEGYLEAEDRVAIIEDVITTGTQTLRAIEAAEAAGAEVLSVICLVDRLAGAREKMPKYIGYYPLLTIEDLGINT